MSIAMRKTQAGFTLVEIVVASAIISFSLVSMVAIASNSIAYSRRSLNTYGASAELEEGMEVTRMLQAQSWASIANLTPNTQYYFAFTTAPDTWAVSTTPKTDGIYTRTLTVTPVSRASGAIVPTGTDDPGTKLVTITVTWQESGVTVTKTLSGYISDIYS